MTASQTRTIAPASRRASSAWGTAVNSRETANDFASQALDLPETMAVYNVAGGDDYLVHVAVSDSTALQSLIIDRILVIQQVAHCRTQLIFGEPWTSPLRRSEDSGVGTRRRSRRRRR
ncbi:MAG: Lrp/AsnC ligand binding domain-containing protein [Microlunatus sp.]|nr:Lrp/AsnC ligand binding domain-containing protein [Microlunatus sp.]